MKRLTILGSTGSIGKNVINIARMHKDKFKIIALSANKNTDELAKQINEFKPAIVSVGCNKTKAELEQKINTKIPILTGIEGLNTIAEFDDTDMVISSVVGSIGLSPLLCAIKAKKNIAFANKEAMVMAGDIILSEAKKHDVTLLPIDSEHSAIFQCLCGQKNKDIKNIILTASGGPFKNKNKDELKNITPIEAANHPRWDMGKKISVDSATLMNKGLEVIEAKWLFNIDVDKIKVIIHPESIVHSMVEFVDNSILAQLSIPDMKIAIQYALTYPDRFETQTEPLDFIKAGSLTFFEPDYKKFSCLKLAFDVCRQGGSAPCILNAANEIAVGEFLKENIKFLDIEKIIKQVLDKSNFVSSYNLEQIIEIDKQTRKTTQQIIKEKSC